MKKLIMVLCIIGISTTLSFATNPKNDWSVLPSIIWDSPIQIYNGEVLLPFKEALGDWIDTTQEEERYDTFINPPDLIKKRYTNAFVSDNMFVVGYEEYKYEEDKSPKDMIVLKRVLLTFDFDYDHKVSLLKNITFMKLKRNIYQIRIVEDAYRIRYQLKLLDIKRLDEN